ncbi:UDP-N-acetylmuramoyl-L-alanine--D-glutamate ligase [Alkalicoccus luteus]|uniref:UDP-N-acetylmuramoylalanine--D-glutamate ligase n=1 Tax=Alkalicoccus luteus TaxID=1237094 RepID=A0A969PLL3_9BACI|nr:UDP-N-acetylmuramoyl-L-alanine--D-glutamate ligase [Alkalicoccus luteus]NJP36446.1 UDP-N-acetylmuramoyl-L-alanine--D-glutamate ligase [Alkalicoccus luteus]
MFSKKEWKNRRVLILGLARSGTEAANLLHQLGAEVTVNDSLAFERNELAQELDRLGIRTVCGSHPPELIEEMPDVLVKNPGIRYDHELVQKAVKAGIPVITEVEAAFDTAPCDMIGITGSNGKTTTTTYIYEMLKGSSRKPLLAGNIGETASKVVRSAEKEHVMVTELSSFQLMGTIDFRPNVAVLLNIADAHLDYHGSKDAYIEAKSMLFRNQTETDTLVYNADDPTVCSMVESAASKKVPFSTEKWVEEGACLMDGWLWLHGEKLILETEFSLPGSYNIANGLAAAAAAAAAGAKIEQIKAVLRQFGGVEHRLQHVMEWKGRSFFNNSKATNVPAAVTSLQAFTQPVVLIAGGLDRGLSFDELVPELSNVYGLVSYGETAPKLEEAGAAANVPERHQTEILQEAVVKAIQLSREGDVILLSPACASWDQFSTFEERGRTFIQAVEQATGQKAGDHA